MLHKLGIQSRLTIGFSVVAGLFIATLLAVAWLLSDLTNDVRKIGEETLDAVVTTDAMNLGRSDAQQFLTDVSATHDPDGYKDAAEANQKFHENIAKFKQLYKDDAKAQQQLDAMDANFAKFYASGQTMAQTYVEQGMEAGNLLMKGSAGHPGFDDASEAIQKQLDTFRAEQLTQATHITAEALGKARTMMQVMLACGVVAALLAVVCGVWIIRGVLSRLGGEPGVAVSVARRVGAGDLSYNIELRTGDDHSLLAQLKQMQQGLVDVVTQVRQGADNVATSSSEIAQGTHDLAQRTEHQASALEQTAAAMKEFAAAVGHNSDSAHQANQLAMTAASIASQGGAVVAQVVDTMKGINESSHKISEIISVIDGIAFQTNILALNAAVEAARAGEQGRGFAVVASEVRSLAGRSANAAKEIKVLIDASVERVGTGTALVDKAGATMTDVVDSIRRVTDIMGEISHASQTQSRDVAQVDTAVAQMDQITQQNAALVEQVSAAASTLRTQAQDLVHTVAAFKLGSGQPAILALPRY